MARVKFQLRKFNVATINEKFIFKIKIQISDFVPEFISFQFAVGSKIGDCNGDRVSKNDKSSHIYRKDQYLHKVG